MEYGGRNEFMLNDITSVTEFKGVFAEFDHVMPQIMLHSSNSLLICLPSGNAVLTTNQCI